MFNIQFSQGKLEQHHQQQLKQGFEAHSAAQDSPAYEKLRFNWSVVDDNNELIAVLTADLLWGWMYIDELWVDERCRGTGMGKRLVETAEQHAIEQGYTGLWLWTQSWQAPKFYESLGFVEFTRFEDFPKGHSRIGLRKELVK